MKKFWSKLVLSVVTAALVLSIGIAFAATTVYQGMQSIGATGTRIAISTAQEVDWIALRALKSNKRVIKIGSVTVTDSIAITDGYALLPGESIVLPSCDLVDLYINGYIGDDVYWVAASGGATVQGGWSYSGEKGVATTVIKASAGTLHGVLIETDGTNSVTVQLYDHASTATNPITPSIVVAGGDNYGGMLGIDAICSNGIVLVLSGSNGVATVIYK